MTIFATSCPSVKLICVLQDFSLRNFEIHENGLFKLNLP